MVEHKLFNYLYLGKLANSVKKNFGKPKICVILQGCRWEKAKTGVRSGRLVFPSDFDGVIPTDIATTEQLRYYGCSLADQNQVR